MDNLVKTKQSYKNTRQKLTFIICAFRDDDTLLAFGCMLNKPIRVFIATPDVTCTQQHQDTLITTQNNVE